MKNLTLIIPAKNEAESLPNFLEELKPLNANITIVLQDNDLETINSIKNTKNVNYHGFLDNGKIIDLLKKIHIFSYPSIWHETSCIAAIEAMAAGCEVVTTNLGALYETCSPFGTLVNFDRNFNNLEKKYSKFLLNSIKNFWSEENQKKLKLQSETINSTYSWNVRAIEWKDFFNEARRLKG